MSTLFSPQLCSLGPDPCITLCGTSAATALASERGWVLWRPDNAHEYGSMRAEAAVELLRHSVPWESFPWQPVQVLPATMSIMELPTELRFPIIALEEGPGEITSVLTIEKLMMRLREAYRRLHAQLETTLEAVNDAITIVDERQQVVGWNWAAEKMFSIKRHDILGQPHVKFFDLSRQWCTRVLKTGEQVRQLSHSPRDGVHVIINSLPIYLDGHLTGAVSAEHDFSNFVLLQNLLLDANWRMGYLKSEVERLRQVDDPFQRITGRSTNRQELVRRLKKVAPTSATVLIRGESGVGKELVAAAVHAASTRAGGPLVTINCGAVPPTLFETELFGYDGGAFTGADRRGKCGRLEQAHKGTLFLDEVGDLPLEMQVKLLRVLERQEFYRVGGSSPVQVDVRFVTATNQHLERMIEQGKFREDLFYRLRVVTMQVPPLRQRPEDIPDLIYLFLQEFSVRYRHPIHEIDPQVMHVLLHHTWPGNVRELRNVVEQLVVLADDGVARAEYLPEELLCGNGAIPAVAVLPDRPEPPLPTASAPPASTPTDGLPGDLPPLAAASRASERNVIMTVLAATSGNRTAAARLLGISRPTLYAKMRRMGIA